MDHSNTHTTSIFPNYIKVEKEIINHEIPISQLPVQYTSKEDNIKTEENALNSNDTLKNSVRVKQEASPFSVNRNSEFNHDTFKFEVKDEPQSIEINIVSSIPNEELDIKSEEQSFNLSDCKDNMKYIKRRRRRIVKPKTFSCSECPYVGSRKKLLIQHMLVHSSEKPFKCELCGYRTSRKGHLKEHMIIHGAEKTIKCEKCDYKTARKSTMKRHLVVHTKEKIYKCDRCNYKTSRKNFLNEHVIGRCGEKPLLCRICDYKTLHKSNLNEHMKRHDAEKLFKCDKCKYKTSRRSDLKKHTVIHNTANYFKCDKCEYKSAQRACLNQHMIVHTGEKLQCNICEYETFRKFNLKKHMCSHSGGNLDLSRTNKVRQKCSHCYYSVQTSEKSFEYKECRCQVTQK